MSFEFLQRLLKSRILRVALFGCVAVVSQTLVFEILGIWLEILRPSLATVVGGEAGLLTSFFLNNRYSFNDREHGPFLTRLIRFHLVVSGSIFIQWLFVFTAESFTTNLWIIHVAFALGIITGFLSNYTGYRLWVWQHHGEQATLGAHGQSNTKPPQT